MTTQATCAIQACILSAQSQQREEGSSNAKLLPSCPSMAEIEANMEAVVRALRFRSLPSQACRGYMYRVVHGIIA